MPSCFNRPRTSSSIRPWATGAASLSKGLRGGPGRAASAIVAARTTKSPGVASSYRSGLVTESKFERLHPPILRPRLCQRKLTGVRASPATAILPARSSSGRQAANRVPAQSHGAKKTPLAARPRVSSCDSRVVFRPSPSGRSALDLDDVRRASPIEHRFLAVKGLMPLRALVAGLRTTLNLHQARHAMTPGPFLRQVLRVNQGGAEPGRESRWQPASSSDRSESASAVRTRTWSWASA